MLPYRQKAPKKRHLCHDQLGRLFAFPLSVPRPTKRPVLFTKPTNHLSSSRAIVPSHFKEHSERGEKLDNLMDVSVRSHWTSRPNVMVFLLWEVSIVVEHVQKLVHASRSVGDWNDIPIGRRNLVQRRTAVGVQRVVGDHVNCGLCAGWLSIIFMSSLVGLGLCPTERYRWK